VPGNQGGESETIIGNWMKRRGNRSRVVIATKLGSDLGDGKKGLSAKYMMQAVEASLKRLKTDYIDLYQSHFDDLDTPVEETMEAFARLIKEGKIRAAGASNLGAQRLRQSLDYCKKAGLPGYQTLQPEYNLYERQQYEKEYEPIVLQEGLSVLNYFALASGFLSGKYRSPADAVKSTRGNGIVSKYINPRGLRILQALDAVAERCRCSPATVALAWLMARPGIAAPIASATTTQQLQELVAAAALRLDGASIELLNAASAPDEP
jgi:aryl-alcohol dehydrogenase-like predicted oxidoreductase